MQNYPKILFIADEIPQTINAGSIQFYRLFKNYPPENLLVFGKKPGKGAKILTCKYYDLEFHLLDRIRLSRFSSVLSDLQALNLFLPSLPKNLKKIANDFKPDIIISLMQQISYYHSAYSYAKEKNIPLILFCHDDAEEFSRVHAFLKTFLIRLNKKIYSFAQKRINISPEMEIAWKNKYGCDGEVQYPITTRSIVPRAMEESNILRNKKQFTIGYAGSLAYGYREGIENFIPILKETNSVLNIYQNGDWDPHCDHVQFKGFSATAEDTWIKIKVDCDAVLLPYSWLAKHKTLLSTHFPSKLPEYLSLGMPVIITGPHWATGVKWGEENKDSILLLNESNRKNWGELLKLLSSNSQWRKELSIAAIKKKLNYFDPEVLKLNFLAMLEDLSKETNQLKNL